MGYLLFKSSTTARAWIHLLMTTKGSKAITCFREWNGAKLVPGAIALIIVDESYIIQKCHVLGGVSILSKFKEVPSYEGKHVGAVLDEHHMMKQTLKKTQKVSCHARTFHGG